MDSQLAKKGRDRVDGVLAIYLVGSETGSSLKFAEERWRQRRRTELGIYKKLLSPPLIQKSRKLCAQKPTSAPLTPPKPPTS